MLFVARSVDDTGSVMFNLQLIRQLSADGGDARFFSWWPPQTSAERARAAGVATGPTPPPSAGQGRRSRVRALVAEARAADVIVSTQEWGRTLELAWLASVAARKPLVIEAQNNLQKVLEENATRREAAFAHWTYRRARCVVPVAEGLVEQLHAAFGVPRSRIVPIHNAINLDRARALAHASDESGVPVDGEPIVLSIGRLTPQKAYDQLIIAHARALRDGPRHRLVLVGEGAARTVLEGVARERGVMDSVTFTGHLTNPFPLLARTALFCLSSRYEGLPLVLAESLSLGVPTLATDCISGPREILRDGDYGELVPVDAPDALARAIAAHLREPAVLRARAAAAEAWLANFSIHEAARRYAALFARIAGKAAVARPLRLQAGGRAPE